MSGSRQRPCFFANDTMIVAQVFLEAMEGCHLLLGPLFVMQTAIFRVCPSAVVQIFAAVCLKRAARSFRRRLSATFRVSFLRPVSTVSGRFSLWRLTAARSLRALNRSSFSWLLSVARFFAASSRIARKRCSLSCPVSLARLRAACFRLVPRCFSLCSVVSRARLEALLSRIIFKRFSRSSLDSWDILAKTRFRLPSTVPVFRQHSHVHASPGLFFCVLETLLWRPCVLLVVILFSWHLFVKQRPQRWSSSRHLCAMSQQHFGALLTMLADKPT